MTCYPGMPRTKEGMQIALANTAAKLDKAQSEVADLRTRLAASEAERERLRKLAQNFLDLDDRMEEWDFADPAHEEWVPLEQAHNAAIRELRDALTQKPDGGSR